MTTPCFLAVLAVEGLRNQQIAPLLKVVKSDPESSATLIRLTGCTLSDHPNGSLLDPIHISPSHSDRLNPRMRSTINLIAPMLTSLGERPALGRPRLSFSPSLASDIAAVSLPAFYRA